MNDGSAELVTAFTAAEMAYAVTVAHDCEKVTLTPVAEEGCTLTVAGAAVESGKASEVALPGAETKVEVVARRVEGLKNCIKKLVW